MNNHEYSLAMQLIHEACRYRRMSRRYARMGLPGAAFTARMDSDLYRRKAHQHWEKAHEDDIHS